MNKDHFLNATVFIQLKRYFIALYKRTILSFCQLDYLINIIFTIIIFNIKYNYIYFIVDEFLFLMKESIQYNKREKIRPL